MTETELRLRAVELALYRERTIIELSIAAKQGVDIDIETTFEIAELIAKFASKENQTDEFF